MDEENIIPFSIKTQHKKGLINLNGCIKDDKNLNGIEETIYINCFYAKKVQAYDVLDQLYIFEK